MNISSMPSCLLNSAPIVTAVSSNKVA
jgi:hypothetical protein